MCRRGTVGWMLVAAGAAASFSAVAREYDGAVVSFAIVPEEVL